MAVFLTNFPGHYDEHEPLRTIALIYTYKLLQAFWKADWQNLMKLKMHIMSIPNCKDFSHRKKH